MSSIFVRFGAVIEAFGKEKYSPVMLNRIEINTRDLSDFEMGALCNLLIDHCERAPTVAKVNEYASLVRNRRDRLAQDPETHKFFCEHCWDTGVTRVKGAEIDSLMLCMCDSRDQGREGPRNPWKLPRWNERFAGKYKKEKPPLEWFKPAKAPGSVSYESAVSLAEGWRERIKIAEQFWKQNGVGA
jgi:hypothetical protein